MLDTFDADTDEMLPDEDDQSLEFEAPLNLDIATLSGDVRDALLTRFRMLTKP